MGYKDRVDDAKRKQTRGATNNARRLEGLGSKSEPRAQRHWGDVDPAWIAAFVVLLSDAGGAVRFGRSRDGAVLSVGVYLDQDSATLWLDDGREPEQQLSDLYEQLRQRIGE